MKILVISDTHYRINNALSVIEQINPTHIFHLGDMVSDAEDIQNMYSFIEMHSVRGNNDYFTQRPDNLTVELNGIKFFLTHGHGFGVKAGTSSLAQYAKSLGVNYALFGHTHQLYDKTVDDVRMLNPSSSGYIIIDKFNVEVNKY